MLTQFSDVHDCYKNVTIIIKKNDRINGYNYCSTLNNYSVCGCCDQ